MTGFLNYTEWRKKEVTIDDSDDEVNMFSRPVMNYKLKKDKRLDLSK